MHYCLLGKIYYSLSLQLILGEFCNIELSVEEKACEDGVFARPPSLAPSLAHTIGGTT